MPVQNDPADIQGNRQRHQARAQGDEESNGSATASDLLHRCRSASGQNEKPDGSIERISFQKSLQPSG